MTAQGAVIPTTGSHHPALTFPAPAVSYYPLADGDAGTFETLDAMKACVLGQVPPDFSGYRDGFNCRVAADICATSPGHAAMSQVAALFQFVTHQIRYEAHPINQQVCQDAKRTIEIGSGDCVSKSVLLVTLLACLGYRPYFIAQWLDGEEASHVYVGLMLDGEELRLDPVASDKPMGWSQKTLDGGFEVAWEIFE